MDPTFSKPQQDLPVGHGCPSSQSMPERITSLPSRYTDVLQLHRGDMPSLVCAVCWHEWLLSFKSVCSVVLCLNLALPSISLCTSSVEGLLCIPCLCVVLGCEMYGARESHQYMALPGLSGVWDTVGWDLCPPLFFWAILPQWCQKWDGAPLRNRGRDPGPAPSHWTHLLGGSSLGEDGACGGWRFPGQSWESQSTVSLLQPRDQGSAVSCCFCVAKRYYSTHIHTQ